MTPTVALPARVTRAQAQACLQHLQNALASATGPAFCVDAAALQQFDSSALAVLLALRRQASAAGKPLQVLGWPPRLAALAALYGVGEGVLDGP